jgi:ATP-dependent DNA ligase
MAEVYGTKNGQPIPQQQTSALLNSSLYKSLTDQEKNNIKLKAMLFGVAKYNDEKVKFDLPYDKRKEILIDALKLLPKDQFHLPEEAKGAKAALELWHKIKQDKHTHTNEGVVIHPPVGVPTKVKLMPEQDVYIRSFFPGEGKYTNKGVGGFYYSHTPKGEIAGKVGTGFDDSLRILMFKNPKQFIGRKARVHSQGELPSGALRAPALINIHEG